MPDLVTLAEKRLKQLKVPFLTIGLSNRKDKKLYVRILLDDGSFQTVHFGDKYSTTYLEQKDEAKKRAYQARASKIKDKNGRYTYKIPYTANWLAYHVLWN